MYPKLHVARIKSCFADFSKISRIPISILSQGLPPDLALWHPAPGIISLTPPIPLVEWTIANSISDSHKR